LNALKYITLIVTNTLTTALFFWDFTAASSGNSLPKFRDNLSV